MFHVFLSHDHKDIKLIDRIWKILSNIKINSYIYEYFREYGEYIPETIKMRIKESLYFVVFLTKNGIKSQWVNQEIGIAHAYDDKLIIPVKEIGVKSKGFIELREHIEYDPNASKDVDYMIHCLITRLRGLLLMSYDIPDGLTLECNCGNRIESELPSIETVNHTIEKKFVFKTKCPKCQKNIQYSPYTFEPIKETKGIRLLEH